MTEHTIKLQWDSEASVWIATSEDVPGLVLESGSFDLLLERVKTAAPEILTLNGIASECTLHFVADRREILH